MRSNSNVWLRAWSACLTFVIAAVTLAGHANAIPGQIYVTTCCVADTIATIAPGQSVVTLATSGLSTPSAIAVDAAGDIFVANYGNDTIEQFTPSGVGSVFATTPSIPLSLAFDAAGNLYAGYDNNTIVKFTSGGVASVFASSGLDDPSGLAFDAAGNLFVANGDNTIERFTTGGVGSVFAADPLSPMLSAPTALAFDANGNLFVANFLSGIVEFSPAGAASAFAQTPDEAEGLAFDPAGNLLVAAGGAGEIIAISPTGTQSIVADGLYVTTAVAVQSALPAPVPEPRSTIPLVFGLLMLGLLRVGSICTPQIRRAVTGSGIAEHQD